MRAGPITIAAAVSFALLATAPVSSHAASPRHAAIVDEYIDGKLEPSSAIETALIGELTRAGITLIDADQSRKIRALASPTQLTEAALPNVVTTRDADVIIAGVAKLSRLEGGLLGTTVIAYEATIQLRVIAVATGQIVATFRERGTGRELTREAAVLRACESAAAKLAQPLIDKLEAASGARKIELEVAAGAPLSAAAVESIQRAAQAAPGVSRVRVARRDEKSLHLELEVAHDASVQNIARALDQTLPVFGRSERQIRAKYSPRVPLIVSPVAPEKRKKTWHGLAITQIVAASLARNGIFDTEPADKSQALLFAGTYREEKGGIAIESRVTGAAGAILATEKRTCPEEQLGACSVALADALAAKLAAPPLNEKPLELTAPAPADITPARRQGTLKIKNRGTERAEKLMLTTALIGSRPVQTALPDVEPGATIEAPVNLALDRYNKDSPALLSFILEYRAGDLYFEEKLYKPLLIHVDRPSESGASANEKGVSLARSGQLDRAKAAFEAARRLAYDATALRNNLANLRLVEGDPKAALEIYEEILQHSPDRVEVRLNALLAATLARDHKKVGDHALQCPDDKVRALMQQLASNGTNGQSLAQFLEWL